MILPSMSWKEMFDAIGADVPKVNIRVDKIRPKAIKFFRKSTSFPVWYIDEYKIPATNNLHVIFFYAGNIREIEKPRYQSFCIVFSGNQRYVIRGARMGYKHTPNSDIYMLPQIHAYTSHFLQRYNERFLHNFNRELLSTNEIAGLFFVRNSGTCIPININEEVNRNYKKHGGHNDKGMRVKDGFCFTQTAIDGEESEDGIREHDRVDSMLILYTTFMNESDMSKTQISAINKEHLDIIRLCMEDLRTKVIGAI